MSAPGAKGTLGLQSLAAAFDGLVCAEPDDIHRFFAEDIRINPGTDEGFIMNGDEAAMLRHLPEETKKLVRQYILRGYIAGWTRCELEILGIKARART